MKTRSILHSCLAALAALTMPAAAQIDGPPEFIDYQGRVLDALGDPVAQGTTENIEMYFRIWDHISDGQIVHLLWAEKQIVTVADGNFSVRLGEGDPIENSAGDNVINPGNDDPRPPLLTVFDGNERFLGVSVAPNSVTKPLAEIQPRLAFLTTPFAAVAEKARFAEFGPSTGVFEAALLGVGTSTPGSLIEAAGSTQLTPTSGSGLISAGAISGVHIALDANDIQGYSNGSTPSVLNLNDHGGNINMGSPSALTTIEGNVHLSTGNLGVGVAPSPTLRLIAGSLAVTTGGSVGIGTTSPTDTLTIGNSGSVRLNGGDFRPLGTQFDGIRWVDTNGNVQAHIHRFGSSDNRLYFTNNGGGNLTGLYLASGATFLVSTSDERLKSDIEPVTGILDKIRDIRVVGFNMKDMQVDPETKQAKVMKQRPPRKTKSGKTIRQEIGSIAQDWVKDFPELVIEPQNSSDHYGLAYERIGVVALGAAQELDVKLRETEAKLKERDEQIADLEARLARLEALMSAAK